MNKPNEAIVEHSRFLAAQYAIHNASCEDIILLAGKGHEDYQVLASETVHYSDRESAQTLLGKLRKSRNYWHCKEVRQTSRENERMR